MNILLGIGNELNGDDAIGIWVARKFKADGWISIDCATVPENYIGDIARAKPEEIVLVDAAEMGLEPGEIRIIPKEKLSKASFSTHTIPLSIFMTHLGQMTRAKIYLIGIQPKRVYGDMSREVMKAGEKVIDIIKNGRIDEIKPL